MIIQTAPAAQPRLAIMMYEHTALAHQFARAFGNRSFQAPDPLDHRRAWATALVLMTLVLVMSLVARIGLNWSRRNTTR